MGRNPSQGRTVVEEFKIFMYMFLFTLLLFLNFSVVNNAIYIDNSTKFELVFFDDFNKRHLDETAWSIIPRNKYGWGKYMSPHPSLIKSKCGYLRLFARRNDGIAKNDSAQYLTGGISTEKKKTIRFGKVEVRARIHGAVGSWPAIWLLKSEPNKTWPDPDYSEIDILEYPNQEKYIMQTVHNYYTMHLKRTEDPLHTARPVVNAEEYNVYSVEILPQAVVFRVNGEETFRYPKIETREIGQYPFGCESYLIIDMQVGASWLPEPQPDSFPAYMDIDWVKFYDLVM